ncbi:MAG: DUF370 domain-containing protein [Clostridia bacterium]|nr:DUF370 domain-containing protein [Clostridia bacterium]MBQ7727438.1 DUF370 domain-containing protein [Clostridia bacterium]
MYLHIGNHIFIRERKIIGIFDTDNATVSNITRKFLVGEEKRGNIQEAKEQTLPKSFILYEDENKKEYKIYFSQLSSSALAGRSAQEKLYNMSSMPKD